MIVEMTPKYAEYERHKGERFETDGKTYKVGGDEVYYLKGYGAYAKDGLRELGGGGAMTRERWEQILFAHVSDEVVQDMLNQYVLELESSNAHLRKLVSDMLPFAEVGMDDSCVTRRCCLYEQCITTVGGKCLIEDHMLSRMRELRVEADG